MELRTNSGFLVVMHVWEVRAPLSGLQKIALDAYVLACIFLGGSVVVVTQGNGIVYIHFICF